MCVVTRENYWSECLWLSITVLTMTVIINGQALLPKENFQSQRRDSNEIVVKALEDIITRSNKNANDLTKISTKVLEKTSNLTSQLEGLASDIKDIQVTTRFLLENTIKRKKIENLAFRKTTIDTSTYGRFHEHENAVDGNLDNVFATKFEDNPTFRLDLGSQCNVFEIEVYNRKKHFGTRFKEVYFKVGNRLADLHFCGKYEGPSTFGERIIIRCPTVMIGRYVELQKEEKNATLDFAEVLVWGTLL